MSALPDDWVAKARGVPIETEIDRRGIKLRRVGLERVGACPKCGGDDRFAINIKKQVFNCRGCTVGGDIIELVRLLDGCDFITACTTLAGEPPPKKVNGKDRAGIEPTKVVAAEFEYPDENGALLFVVERIEYQNADGSFEQKDGKRKKTFRQKRPDPDRPSEWLWNVDGVPVVPYRLPELIEAVAAGHPIFVVEGEACVELLRSWNVAATCNSGGASKWREEHSKYLRGADVVLVPDNDEPGWKHINEVGASLNGVATVRVLVLPGLPPKGDIVDWATARCTREQLDNLIAEAPEWKPPTEKLDDLKTEKKTDAARFEDELLDALARMPKGVEFGRERKRLAKELDVSHSDIDAEIGARRVEAETTAMLHGHWYVEPWPDPVDGDALIRDIIRKLQKHVVISHDHALAIALWVMLAWVHEAIATHSPILDITSAEPESGKSTTIGLISFLAPRCLSTVEISEAAVYRAIERWAPSFAIDEFDNVLASDEKIGLRSVINSGHVRGQGVVRCVGDDMTPQLFKTFAPKCIGMIGRKLPAATLSRCIMIELRRRKKDEGIEKFKHEDDTEFADLRGRLRRWEMDNEETLRAATVSMPETFDNRRADNWRVQFAIADLAGDDWSEQARAAAVEIEGGNDSRTPTMRLLAAIKAVFDSIGDDAVGSKELCERLAADDSSEWAEWGRARKPITQNQLARMLKEHHIHPDHVRPKALGDKQVRGYQRSWFEDIWPRYL